MASADTNPRSIPPIAALTLVAAALAVVVSAMVGGAAAPAVDGIQDPGAVVRWGLPLVRAVHDLSAATAIGLWIITACTVPDRATSALVRGPRVAIQAAVVWIVSGLLGVVLGFADIAGMPLGSTGFATQFRAFVWSIEPLREGLISAALAAIAVAIVALSSRRLASLWAGIVGLVAIFPLALAGHAASTIEHETAVNALLFHMVGTVAWVGGLAAVTILRPTLGKWLPVVVERYSKIAAWSLLTVGLSGVVSAAVRMEGLGDLGTAYGALILAKVVALGALGLLGLAQRRQVVARLRQDPSSVAAFARLVIVELAVMGATIGVATALARTGNPNKIRPRPETIAEALTNYPMPSGPTGASWITMWRWDYLWGTVAVIAIALYVGAVVRLHKRGDRWPIGRTISWVVGWFALIWATCGAPGVFGRFSFSWHMILHMVVAMVVPIFLVLAGPITLVARVAAHRKDGTYGPREIVLGLVHSKYLAAWANPVVAAINFSGSLILFYYTPFFELALTTHTGHVLMIIHFLLAGYLFCMVLVGTDPGPRKWAPSLRLVVLFVTISFHAFFGVAMMSMNTLLAEGFFGVIDVPWVPDKLADQAMGGTIAWGIGDFPSLLLAMLVVLAWVKSDAAEARRHDRQADRDGDADLVAYNAELAALARQDRRDAAAEDAQRRAHDDRTHS